MQDQQNAQRILNQLTQKGEIDFPPLDQRAEQLAAAGQTRLAIELYQNWIQHHPGHVHLVDAWFALGSTLSNGITQGSIPSNHQNLAQVRDAYICARDIYSSTARLRYDQYLNLLELYVALGSLYAKLDLVIANELGRLAIAQGGDTNKMVAAGCDNALAKR
ncbi:hypothetical protein FACS189497_03900 [Betaproteobacteria bacterium]|nr:hypothetical protein FACS189497_03900 [Betaproteobacteria bacterium]